MKFDNKRLTLTLSGLVVLSGISSTVAAQVLYLDPLAPPLAASVAAPPGFFPIVALPSTTQVIPAPAAILPPPAPLSFAPPPLPPETVAFAAMTPPTPAYIPPLLPANPPPLAALPPPIPPIPAGVMPAPPPLPPMPMCDPAGPRNPAYLGAPLGGGVFIVQGNFHGNQNTGLLKIEGTFSRPTMYGSGSGDATTIDSGTAELSISENWECAMGAWVFRTATGTEVFRNRRQSPLADHLVAPTHAVFGTVIVETGVFFDITGMYERKETKRSTKYSMLGSDRESIPPAAPGPMPAAAPGTNNGDSIGGCGPAQCFPDPNEEGMEDEPVPGPGPGPWPGPGPGGGGADEERGWSHTDRSITAGGEWVATPNGKLWTATGSETLSIATVESVDGVGIERTRTLNCTTEIAGPAPSQFFASELVRNGWNHSQMYFSTDEFVPSHQCDIDFSGSASHGHLKQKLKATFVSDPAIGRWFWQKWAYKFDSSSEAGLLDDGTVVEEVEAHKATVISAQRPPGTPLVVPPQQVTDEVSWSESRTNLLCEVGTCPNVTFKRAMDYANGPNRSYSRRSLRVGGRLTRFRAEESEIGMLSHQATDIGRADAPFIPLQVKKAFQGLQQFPYAIAPEAFPAITSVLVPLRKQEDFSGGEGDLELPPHVESEVYDILSSQIGLPEAP